MASGWSPVGWKGATSWNSAMAVHGTGFAPNRTDVPSLSDAKNAHPVRDVPRRDDLQVSRGGTTGLYRAPPSDREHPGAPGRHPSAVPLEALTPDGSGI